MIRQEPTIEEKIRALPDLGELEGAEDWLIAEGQMTPRIKTSSRCDGANSSSGGGNERGMGQLD